VAAIQTKTPNLHLRMTAHTFGISLQFTMQIVVKLTSIAALSLGPRDARESLHGLPEASNGPFISRRCARLKHQHYPAAVKRMLSIGFVWMVVFPVTDPFSQTSIRVRVMNCMPLSTIITLLL
jgi:hypothetical protein